MELLPSPSPSCLSAASRCAASCASTSTELTHLPTRQGCPSLAPPPTLPTAGPDPSPAKPAVPVCTHSSETQNPPEMGTESPQHPSRAPGASRQPKEGRNEISLHHFPARTSPGLLSTPQPRGRLSPSPSTRNTIRSSDILTLIPVMVRWKSLGELGLQTCLAIM